MKPQPTQPAASQRLLSLDALRGFDMLSSWDSQDW